MHYLINIHVLPRSAWFLVACTVTKTTAFFAVWVNGNQLQFKAATTSSQKFHFFGLLFVYLLVVYVCNVFTSYFTLNS